MTLFHPVVGTTVSLVKKAKVKGNEASSDEKGSTAEQRPNAEVPLSQSPRPVPVILSQDSSPRPHDRQITTKTKDDLSQPLLGVITPNYWQLRPITRATATALGRL